MFLVRERRVGDGTDCQILTQSSSDHSRTSSSFCWAAQPGSWGPKPSVWRWLSLRHLVPNCDWNSNCDCNSNWTLPASNSNCLKPSVAPGYIIVWHPPDSCGHTHLHRIQPRPQVKVIFWNPRPDAPAFCYTGASLNWRLSRGSICYNVIKGINELFHSRIKTDNLFCI